MPLVLPGGIDNRDAGAFRRLAVDREIGREGLTMTTPSPWVPIATRGMCDLRVFTAARLRASGADAPSEYLVFLIPHGDADNMTHFWSPSLDSLASFCREMDPVGLRVHADDGEDGDMLVAFLRRGERTS
jgi:hypothetical protein